MTIHVVVKKHEKRLIRQAAALSDSSMSAFSRRVLMREAHNILNESSFFCGNAPCEVQIHPQKESNESA